MTANQCGQTGHGVAVRVEQRAGRALQPACRSADQGSAPGPFQNSPPN